MQSIRNLIGGVLPALVAFGCGAPESVPGVELDQKQSAVEMASERDRNVIGSVAMYFSYGGDFEEFETAGSNKTPDGKLGMSDLQAMMQDTSKPRFSRLVAGVLLENFSFFSRGGFIRPDDLERVAQDWLDSTPFEGTPGISHMEAAYVAEIVLENMWIDGYVDCDDPYPPYEACPQRPKDGLLDGDDLYNLYLSPRDYVKIAARAVSQLSKTFDTLAANGKYRDGHIGLSDLEAAVKQSGLPGL